MYQRKVMKGEVAITIEGHTDPGIVCKRSGQHFSQKEPMEFSNFMGELAIKCQSKRLNDFWELIVSKNLNFINKGEVVDSDVTEEEAKANLAEGNAGQALDQPLEVDEMGLLLGEVVWLMKICRKMLFQSSHGVLGLQEILNKLLVSTPPHVPPYSPC
ncbi:hypothetical protein SUGI_0415350 [Cryptomeria japonica]|nr:hypothetical protein SUGI_0415350 [Cryptomeria japonica]